MFHHGEGQHGGHPGGHGICACFSVLVMLLIWAMAYIIMPHEVFEEYRELYFMVPAIILAWGVAIYLGLHALTELLYRHRHH